MSIDEKAVEVPAGQPGKRFIPLTMWNKYYDFPPLGGLRHLVFFEKENGFDKVVIRVGSRVILDESAYFEWLRSQKKGVK